jgi:hexosaminidase
VNGKQWNANPAIQVFMKKHGMATARDLQAYFTKRVATIVAKHGKKMIGWDEILHSELPGEILIQTWRGQKILAESVEKGYKGVLSYGYYVDLMLPAADHYLVEPFEKEAGLLSDETRARILGGEACMWGEFLTTETIDSRIWPRTAAIAERFWSPPTVRDIDDMYRRLEVQSRRLELFGLTHRSAYPRMLERMTGGAPTGPLKTLGDIVEPLKHYDRHRLRKFTSFTPLNRLVDAIPPESDRAREFTVLVQAWAADTSRTTHRDEIRAWLQTWRDNHGHLLPITRGSFLLSDVASLSANVAAVASLGLEALHAVEHRVLLSPTGEQRTLLDAAAKGSGEYLIAIVPAVQRIVAAAAEPR